MKYIVNTLLMLALVLGAAGQASQIFKNIQVDSGLVIPRFSSLPGYGRAGAIVYITAGADSGTWIRRPSGTSWTRLGSGGSSLTAAGAVGDIQVNAGGTLSGLGGADQSILKRRGSAWVAEADSLTTNGFLNVQSGTLARYAGGWRAAAYTDSSLVHKKYVDSLAATITVPINGNNRNLLIKNNGTTYGTDSLTFGGHAWVFNSAFQINKAHLIMMDDDAGSNAGGAFFVVDNNNNNRNFEVQGAYGNGANGGTQMALRNSQILPYSGDRVGSFNFSDWNGDVAGITSYMTQDHTSSNKGTDMRFYSTASNTNTLAERMRIGANGNVGIGIAAEPSAVLHLKAGTTSNPQIRLANSSAPTSPAQGDAWFTGTQLAIRDAATTANLHKDNVKTYTGGSVTLDLDAANVHYISLTSNLSIGITNALDGQTGVIILKEDATGGRTISAATNIWWSSTTLPLATGANNTSSWSYVVYGSKLYITASVTNYQ